MNAQLREASCETRLRVPIRCREEDNLDTLMEIRQHGSTLARRGVLDPIWQINSPWEVLHV
jgi:hypothetical protein